jgi:type IV pilus assembly protein PilV
MNKQAFTLIEALVSVVIVAIGFAGVYSLVITSNSILYDSIDREKLNYQAAEIVETIHSDPAQIEGYAHTNLDNTSCDSIKLKDPNKGVEQQLTHLKSWCKKMQGEVKVKGHKIGKGLRQIRVEKKEVDGKNVYIVSINLSAKGDKKTVFIKKVFNAD